ncbi:MAG: hypothetical protein HY644_03865 [Acidobacteria bacterium]|nr:hypothetical protein [Acidobacteriota bacterium]
MIVKEKFADVEYDPKTRRIPTRPAHPPNEVEHAGDDEDDLAPDPKTNRDIDRESDQVIDPEADTQKGLNRRKRKPPNAIE